MLRAHVLFIAVDDLNDWVGCLGGNAQAITPNLDRQAKQQAMVMNKACCPSTVCCPSRSSLLAGKRPYSTGVYGNEQNLKNAPKAKEIIARFKKHLPAHDEPDSPRNRPANGDKKALHKAGKSNDDK